jgi:hypothetical protein
MFYPFESIKNLIKIIFSSYFYTFKAKVGHILSCIFISNNVFKCVLKHVIFQYYVMKSKNFLNYWSFKLKNIHEFNVLRLNLWYFPPKTQVSFHVFTLWKLFYFWLWITQYHNPVHDKSWLVLGCYIHTR